MILFNKLKYWVQIMDITKSTNKIYTNKLLNGETINYSFLFVVFTFAFLVIKQLLKTIFMITPDLSMLISFIVCGIALFFAEKKLVFNKKVNTNIVTQLLFSTIGLCVDFGFYKLFEFLFVNIMKLSSSLVFFSSFIIIFVFKYYFDRLIVFNSQLNAENKSSGRLYKLFFNNRYVVLSVGLTGIGILFVFAIYKLFPFGDYTVLRMDLYHQYGPLFAELYDRVIEHKSFLYSWESGGGSSFLGNYFNYLSSPISIIIFLFDKKQIAFAITTLVIVKGVLSAGTFSYYLKCSLNSHCFASAAFGVFYALSGYFLAYYWNIMWLDGMILLPLIALGIERIINKSKPVLYIASLTVLLYSSYYIGYMACIFSIIYFFAYFILNTSTTKSIIDFEEEKKDFITNIKNNKFISSALKFGLSSILCGALCAVSLIPVFFILQQCSATSDSFPGTFTSYFNMMDMVTSHLAGLETTIRSSGDDVLPNIYCGILPIILLPLFIINKDIRIKDKAVYIVLVILFAFSFNNNCANFVWHAFHFPNDLPYRFSFMYSFIILIIAYKSLMHIKAIRYQDIAIIGMFWVFVILYFQQNPTNKISELSIYISIAFVIIWTAVLLLIKKGNMTKLVIGVTIIAMTFCEVIVSDGNSYVFTQKNKNYVENYDSYTDVIDKTYSDDKDFYRTELCNLMTRMDPCLYGYNGMSAFSSVAYENYSQTQYSLGLFGNRINSYTYNTQTPVYNMMFAVKYLMYKDEAVRPSDEYYTLAYSSDNFDVNAYKNNYYLPIAFETSNDIANWIVIEENPFEQQENFINLATGVSDLYLPLIHTDTECENAYCDSIGTNGRYTFTKNDTNSDYGTVRLTLRTVNDGNAYVYITSPTVENVTYSFDEESISQNIEEPYIYDLGYHNAGEEINVSIDVSMVNDSSSYFDIYAYNINKDVLDSAYDMLKTGELNITEYTDTEITGTINAGYDGFIYTSIPYDDGWTVYIDGEKQKTFEIAESMLATTIKQGEHTVKFKYSPKGFKYGIVITIAAWLCILAYFIIKKIFNKIDNETEIC